MNYMKAQFNTNKTHFLYLDTEQHLFKAINNFENNHTACHVMRRNNLLEMKKEEPLTLRNRTKTSDVMSLFQLVGTVTQHSLEANHEVLNKGYEFL